MNTFVTSDYILVIHADYPHIRIFLLQYHITQKACNTSVGTTRKVEL